MNAVKRPWGHYVVLDAGPGFLVKRLTVDPRQRLSLQHHKHRSEYWLVVSGSGVATRGIETWTLRPGDTLQIPEGAHHRLENDGDVPLVVIEVQRGAKLSEDDITRVADDYGRAEGRA